MKKWSSIVFLLVVISLSTSGSCLSPVYRERSLPKSVGALSGIAPTTTVGSMGPVIFSSALGDMRANRAVILLTPGEQGYATGDLSKGEDKLTSLPEPDSGILLGLGLLAVLPLAGRHGLSFLH